MARRDMRRPLRAIAVIAVGLTVAFAAACGGDDDSSSDTHDMSTMATTAVETTASEPTAPAAEATVIEIPAAVEGLAFEKTEVRAKAGTITLRMPNPSVMPHNIAVDEPEEAIGEVVNQGGVSEITVDFPPGTYEYYCSVAGHRAGGMVGTLIVE